MDNVHIWVTLLTKYGAEALILSLVKGGYTVAALNESGEPYSVNAFGMVLVSLDIEAPDRLETLTDVHGDIVEMLKKLDVGYHLVLVTEAVNCTWSDDGNFTSTGSAPAEQPTMWDRLDE